MIRHLLVFAALAGVMGAAAVAADKEPTDAEKLVGTWVITGLEVGDKKIPTPEGESSYTFSKDGKFVLKSKGETDKEGTFKLDAGKKPPEIDLIPPKDADQKETMQAIYQLDGDTLKLAYSIKGPEGKRPTAFDPKEAAIMTLKRKKP
jgi:uncharacterized protein (TIGR03067 family)